MSQNPHENSEFYQRHLDRVSRSFAFCIARLGESLRETVGLSYLLCRLIDTVEDAPWPSFAEQKRAFTGFDQLIHLVLARPPGLARAESRAFESELESRVDAWGKSFPTGLPEGEVLLIQDAARIFADFSLWPDPQRSDLGRLILSMSGGMCHYMGRKQDAGKLILSDAGEVNRYCFFVAGIVGEMLTRLSAGQRTSGSVQNLRDAFRFGLFLQKVNLLKDQSGDEIQGRYLVPSRPQVLSSLLQDAEAAFRYLSDLPESNVGFRLFCAWSLFLGLASLPWIQAAQAKGEKLKIPREEALVLFEIIEGLISDRTALAGLFNDFLVESRELIEPPVPDESTDEVRATRGGADVEERNLLELYLGDLPEESVLELFRA